MSDNESSLRQIAIELIDADDALHAANLAWIDAHPVYPLGDPRSSASSTWIAKFPDPLASAASERRGKAWNALRAALAVQPEPAQPAPSAPSRYALVAIRRAAIEAFHERRSQPYSPYESAAWRLEQAAYRAVETVIDAIAAAQPAPVQASKSNVEDELRALADSEGSRAVEYLRRARKAERRLLEIAELAAPQAVQASEPAGQHLREIWADATRHMFASDTGCACTGKCSEIGFCPVNGGLHVYLQSDVDELVERAKRDAVSEGEAAEALKWWRAIKSKRGAS